MFYKKKEFPEEYMYLLSVYKIIGIKIQTVDCQMMRMTIVMIMRRRRRMAMILMMMRL